MKKAGLGDGIRDFNFAFPKKVNANDWHLSHFYPIEAYDENQTSRRHSRESEQHSPNYLLALRNKDNSEELELAIELEPSVELAPRSLLIERLDGDSRLDVGKAKLQPSADHRCYFVGHVSSQPGSRVALSACGRGLHGVVQLRDDRFYIQPLSSGTTGAHEGKNPHIIYRKKPIIDGKEMNCLVKEPSEEYDKVINASFGNSQMLKSSLSNSINLLDNFEKMVFDKSLRIEREMEKNRFTDKEKNFQRLEVLKRNGENFKDNKSSFYEDLARNLGSSNANENILESENYINLEHANMLHHLDRRKRRDVIEISEFQNQDRKTQLFENPFGTEGEYANNPVLSNVDNIGSNLSCDQEVLNAIDKTSKASINIPIHEIPSHKGDEKSNIFSRRDLIDELNVSSTALSKTPIKTQRDGKNEFERGGIQNPSINEICLHHLIPLQDKYDNWHLTTGTTHTEPINSQIQSEKEEILVADTKKDNLQGGNLKSEILRAGRSCELTLCKKKLEPIYDVRVLVVVSKHFVEQFDTFDIETLILTLMNMVHGHFHDASIGQLMYVKIVRIIYIQYDMVELDEKKHSVEDLFANFCKFQERVNPPLLTHPNRHDIAIFLTQSKIHDSCGSPPVYGITYSKSVCREDKKCILVTNHGLLTANVITHALGHSLGAEHDDGGEDNCQSKGEDGTNYLMAPTITYNAITWSSCSRRSISRFVLHHASKCLLGYSKPVNFRWSRELLPGQVYTATQQCTLNYRMPSLACFSGDFCKKLYCKMNDRECVSNGEPPADGTYCAKNMWCIKGECLWKGSHVKSAINGGWSDWSNWSPCTRHCGTGVQRSVRICNNPPPSKGGKICAGRRTRYRVCNQHIACPITDPSYRDEQCQLTAPVDEPPVDWHEWSGGPHAEEIGCSLACESFTGVVAVRDVSAANGTPCRPGTSDLCIRGECVPVGCDWVLGSRTRRDACGICRGGGNTCQIIQGIYTEKNGTGYVPFMKVSRGSAMIFMREMKPSDALLAVSSANTGDFYLNAPSSDDELLSQPALSKKFQLAGAPAIYKVKSGMGRLFIDGTVQEDLIFYLKFGCHGNPGVRYQLAVSRDPTSNFEPSYSWRFISWEQCSNPCGGGFQVAEPMCVEDINGIVDDSYCPEDSRPLPITRLCNSFPCKPKWWVGPWSKCNKQSNKRMKTRSVLCVLSQGAAAPTFRIVKDCKCSHSPKPRCSKLCKIKPCGAEDVCQDDRDITALKLNSIGVSGNYLAQTSLRENHGRIQNNKWKQRIYNSLSNKDYIDTQSSLNFQHDDDYSELSIVPNKLEEFQKLSEQEGANPRVDSSLQQGTEFLSISGNLKIESELDDLENNSESDEYGAVRRSSAGIHDRVKRRKKSYKSKTKADTSNDDDIFNEFFDEAVDSSREPALSTASSVSNAREQSTISDIFDEYSTLAEEINSDYITENYRNNEETNTDLIKNDSRKNNLKSEINNTKDVNSNLMSKGVKKSTPTSSKTLYGLLIPNKLAVPQTMKISRPQSTIIDSIKGGNTSQLVLPDTIQLLLHNKKIRKEKLESTTTELAEILASEEKCNKVTPCDTEAVPCSTEAEPCSTEAATIPVVTCPTCTTRSTTCRSPDLCPPTAAPDRPKKVCHEIIENDLFSFTLIRAPIACERSMNSYSDGMYEGDGLLSLLPVVNETCTIFLKGDAALKYLEDSRKCFSGPVQYNILTAE